MVFISLCKSYLSAFRHKYIYMYKIFLKNDDSIYNGKLINCKHGENKAIITICLFTIFSFDKRNTNLPVSQSTGIFVLIHVLPI